MALVATNHHPTTTSTTAAVAAAATHTVATSIMSSRPPRIRNYYSTLNPPSLRRDNVSPSVSKSNTRPITTTGTSTSTVPSIHNSNNNPNNDCNGLDEEHCRHCHSTELRVDWCQGDRVCTNCGLVAEERIRDDRPEWKEFAEAEDLAKGLPAAARCGMIPVDETKYIGGLQPTLLSKHAFGGSTSMEEQQGSGYSLATIRNRLIGTNRKLNKMMEIQHRKAMKDAKVELSIQQQQNKQNKEQQHQQHHRAQKHHYHHHSSSVDEEYSYDHDDEETTSSVRPQYESSLLQEEEDAHRMHAALYSDKWSLTRAVRLYGTPHEQELLDSTGSGGMDQDDTSEDLVQRMDSTLRTAACDLYNAYSMLTQAAQTLNLPDRVVNEAKNRLVRYVARRDGFCIKGVSSRLSSSSSGGDTFGSTSSTAASSSSLSSSSITAQQRKLAAQRLRDYNKLKQMGSLGSALLFLTARNLGWTRSLAEVCESFQPTQNMVHNEAAVATATAEQSFIKPKHSYRAITEIKATFPDYARAMTILGDNGTTGRGGGTGGPQGNNNSSVLQSHPKRNHQSLQNTSSSNGMANNDAMAMANFADHSLRRLQLPPVAEASIRTLFAHCRTEQVQHGEHSGTKLSTLCAAVAYFVCMAGSVMQRLAQQAKMRPSLTSSSSSSSLPMARAKASGLSTMSQPKTSLKRPQKSSKDTTSSLSYLPTTKKRKTESSTSAGNTLVKHPRGILDTSDEDDDDSDSIDSNNRKSPEEEEEEFDVFKHPAIQEDQSEKLEYEMRRMWDAWAEQMPWFRSVGEVEQSCGVSRSVVVDFYKTNLYPRRKGLLQVLKDAASPQPSPPDNASSTSASANLSNAQNSLLDAPFANMLLDHIATAGPLMNSKGKN